MRNRALLRKFLRKKYLSLQVKDTIWLTETTKIRAVFNASCSNSGPSLNDCLYSGPNLLEKIFDILLRFRLNYIGILANIQQAFLNIEISTEHTDFLRFLWYDFRNTDAEKIIVLRFLRVVFGLTSSPFLLNGSIRHHLLKYEKSHPVFFGRFLKDIYDVDDSSSGAETMNEGKKFYVTAKSILSAAGLNLRKWVTNDEDLQQFFDQNENAKSDIDSNLGDDVTFLNSQFKFDENKSKSVLGVEWNTKTDEFVFRFSNLVDQAKSLGTTKRNVLKISASFYDPLGMISPVTARVKTTFQLLCQSKLNWDDSVPREIEIIWNEFISNLEEWGILQVKRFAFFEIRDKIYSVQLNGFCDSLSQIYCAVIYLRIVTHFGIRVSFLAAKTKVTPLKNCRSLA